MNDIDIQYICDTAVKAGTEILKIYETNFSVSYKEHDQSPLTQADLGAHEIIARELAGKYPDIPILSEEGKLTPYENRKLWSRFWLIDPLDGTKEFVDKSGDFTVNIALIEKQTPVLGVVYAPVKGLLYYAQKGTGAYRIIHGQTSEKLPCTNVPAKRQKKLVVASKHHMSGETQKYIDLTYGNSENYELVSVGSSLKFCLVAEGTADMYPRLGPTMEWDTAAAHAIILESGKTVHIIHEGRDSGKSLVYNKENLLNPWFVVS